jgi:acetoin utilization protein AcuA
MEGGPEGQSGGAIEYETPQGEITIRPECPPDFIVDLSLDDGLGTFAYYSSMIHKLESFQAIASRPGDRVTLALADATVIVGYITWWYPQQGERWALLGDLLYELGTIEVSRNYRGLNLAEKMMGLTIDQDFVEGKILYMQGLSWHWDLEGTGLTAGEYRLMMMKLFSKFQFREVYTNEPNLALRVENLMMARIGSRVSAEDQKKFRHLCFGIKPKK